MKVRKYRNVNSCFLDDSELHLGLSARTTADPERGDVSREAKKPHFTLLYGNTADIADETGIPRSTAPGSHSKFFMRAPKLSR
jgi:hypothetical protein